MKVGAAPAVNEADSKRTERGSGYARPQTRAPRSRKSPSPTPSSRDRGVTLCLGDQHAEG